jgi:hypothetical protein
MRSLKLFSLAFMLVSVAGSAMATSKDCNATPPDGADLGKYRLQPGPLSGALKHELGLHEVELTESWIGHNYFHGTKTTCESWQHQALPPGTLVLADASGEPIYKVSCGNRLIRDKDKRCPVCLTCPAGSSCVRNETIHPAGSDFWAQHPWLAWLGTLMREAWRDFLKFLLILLFLALLFLGSRELLAWWDRQQNSPASITPRTPPPAAQPVKAEPVAPVSPPTAPVSDSYVEFNHGEDGNPHTVEFDGHRHVRVVDRGAGRFRIHFRK